MGQAAYCKNCKRMTTFWCGTCEIEPGPATETIICKLHNLLMYETSVMGYELPDSELVIGRITAGDIRAFCKEWEKT